MSDHCIRAIDPSDQAVIATLLAEHWGDRKVVTRGKVLDASTLPGFIAVEDSKIVGLITLHVDASGCEIVTLDAFVAGRGLGTALLQEAEKFALAHSCKRLWLITSNDNVGAMTFYQKLGLRIIAVHLDAIDEARKMKPQIPRIADNRIPIRDEIELEKVLF